MSTRVRIDTAIERWQKETSLPSIPTLSKALDKALGTDGVQLGSITELIGLPGSGKTQLCLQLCAAVQIPAPLAGLDAESLFIDTNTNFTVQRLKEIIEAHMKKCQSIMGDAYNIDESNALSRVHYVKAIGLEKFMALIHQLPSFITEHPKIRLIVIDSIAFPFKEGLPTKQRTGLLYRLTSELHRLAFERKIAVVLTNEMSTRVGLSSGSVVGAMGDAWSHRCNTRVLLSAPEMTSSLRMAYIAKSNLSASTAVKFLITEEGIRDVK